MIVSESEKIAYFRRELSSYKYYLKSIEDINNKIEAIDVELNGVSSPNLRDIPIHSATTETITYRIMELWEEQSKLEKEKLFYQERIKDINAKLNRLSEEDRNMLIDVYVNSIGWDKACMKYNLAKTSLFRKLNHIVGKVI